MRLSDTVFADEDRDRHVPPVELPDLAGRMAGALEAAARQLTRALSLQVVLEDRDAALVAASVEVVEDQGLDRNEWIMVAGAAAAPHLGMPEGVAAGAPGPLGLADPDRITPILEGAGFVEVTLQDLTLPMRIGRDVEDALSFIRSIPFVRDLLAAVPAPQQEAAIDAVRTALAPHAGPDGVVTHNNGVWLVTAWR